MATYRVNGTAPIGATIEPDGRLELDIVGLEDTSSLWGEDVGFECSFEFEIKASSEEEANEKADSALGDLTFYSNDDIEWEVVHGDISFEVERIPSDMPLAEAVRIVKGFLSDMDEDLQEAAECILDAVEDLDARNKRLTHAVNDLTGEVETLKLAVQTANGLRAVAEDNLVQASETPFGPAEPDTTPESA